MVSDAGQVPVDGPGEGDSRATGEGGGETLDDKDECDDDLLAEDDVFDDQVIIEEEAADRSDRV